VKATGAPGYSTGSYPYRNIHDDMHRIFDAFGPDRYFWGTDITRMPCSYRQCVTMFTEELPWLAGPRSIAQGLAHHALEIAAGEPWQFLGDIVTH